MLLGYIVNSGIGHPTLQNAYIVSAVHSILPVFSWKLAFSRGIPSSVLLGLVNLHKSLIVVVSYLL